MAHNSIYFWIEWIVAGLTAFYMFRLYFGIFWSKEKEYEYTPHEAPFSMTFPLIFLAIASAIVGFIPFQDGKPTGEWEVFADGFAGVDIIKQMKNAKYRPMGLAQGPDGSVVISDSKKGKIWRIIFQGSKEGFCSDQLKKMERRKFVSYLKKPVENLDIIK